MEKMLVTKEMAFYVFIDIESVFDTTSHTSIALSLKTRNLHTSLIWWTQLMMRNRLIVASLKKQTKKATTEKDCPQGRLLPPDIVINCRMKIASPLKGTLIT